MTDLIHYKNWLVHFTHFHYRDFQQTGTPVRIGPANVIHGNNIFANYL